MHPLDEVIFKMIPKPCTTCNESGIGKDGKKCKECRGTKEVKVRISTTACKRCNPDGNQQIQSDCLNCDGEGWVVKKFKKEGQNLV